MNEIGEPDFQEVLDALLDFDTPLKAKFLYHLSDLEEDKIHKLSGIWSQIPDWRRIALMEDVKTLGDHDYVLSFEALGVFAVQDPNPKVRQQAVHALWDYEERELTHLYITLSTGDPAPEVRAAAASGLGTCIYHGELKEWPEELYQQAAGALLELINDPKQEKVVRRRALESLGYSSREDVPPIIEEAYQSGDQEWMISALLAMGRSANSIWNSQVLEQLNNIYPQVRAEAIRAAGEIMMKDAAPEIMDYLDDSSDDVRHSAIWALSQIGGEDAKDALLKQYSTFEEMGDEEEIEILDIALEELAFNESLDSMLLMDFPDEELKEQGWDYVDPLNINDIPEN